jgi:amino acid transporter
MASRWRRVLFGRPRDIGNPRTYHAISLVALLAWVGLGADPLSSSAYGPDEAFRALGPHTYLAVALALATTITVVTLSLAYSQIIQQFPFGGGGYTVASTLLGPRLGVVSGSALLVDYVLTISVSIASAGDQMFSIFPRELLGLKLPFEFIAIILLVILNLRGVKESVLVLAPIFALFLATHAVLLIGGIGSHVDSLPRVAADVSSGFRSGLGTLGVVGMLAVFVRAYSMGAGTYTGIEAVSNGLPIMREPRVETARRTMLYIAVSLAITAGGLLLLYLLFEVRPEHGKTLNAVVLQSFAGKWQVAGLPVGTGFVALALFAEAALLFVAAQAGFLDGPRVMANMARDDWLPHRFVQLSERLTVQDGVLLMGLAAVGTLLYTRGNITMLVTMYSINIFVTFSLSQLGMVRHWLRERGRTRGVRRGLAINGVALVLCVAILVGTVYEKFGHGGWVTLLVTSTVVALCFVIRRHYRGVLGRLRSLDELLPALPERSHNGATPPDPRRPTAVLFVDGFGGLGVHALLTIQRLFPGHFANFVFVSVGVIDAAVMKGVDEVERLRAATEEGLREYVDLAGRFGLAAEGRATMATETLDAGTALALEVARDYPRAIFFLGKLAFEREAWFDRLLHNQTAYRLQQRLQFAGLNAMVLPVRVRDGAGASEPAGLR